MCVCVIALLLSASVWFVGDYVDVFIKPSILDTILIHIVKYRLCVFIQPKRRVLRIKYDTVSHHLSTHAPRRAQPDIATLSQKMRMNLPVELA